MKFKLVAVVLILSTLFTLTACTDTTDNADDISSLIALSVKNVNFDALNASKTIDVIYGSSISEKDVRWISTDPNVATCSGGIIVSKGYGTCVVKAITSSGYTSACIVNVVDPDMVINFSEAEYEFMGIGDKHTLTATNYDGHQINTIISWSTSNRSVAVCDDNGVVRATGYGMCTVRAVASNGAFATCAITVSDPDAPVIDLVLPGGGESIKFDSPGEETLISAVTAPRENAKITWQTSDPSVAVCDENGLVKAVGEGICALVAISEDGGSAACVINVGNVPAGNSPPENIMTFGINNVGKTLKYIDRKTGQVIAEFILVSYTLKYSFDPANPNTLIIVPHYNFVKTFDIDGLDGDNTVVAEFNLYTKNDKHCETRSYRVFDKKVGEFFTVEGARFGVAVIDGEIRPFYMTVSLITD